MAIFGDVIGNTITLVTIAIFFWLIYKKMREGKVKDSIDDMIGRVK